MRAVGVATLPFKAFIKWCRSIIKWCCASSGRLVALLVVGVLVVASALVAWFWPEFRVGGTPVGGAEPLSATLRNLALIAAGVVAVILTVWRIRVIEQQAETSRLGLLNERFQRGAEMLGSDVLAVRMGGIHALDDLARERPELYHLRVMLLLCAFVRHPTGYETNLGAQPMSEGATRWYKLRPDVRAAIEAIAYRGEIGLLIEDESDLPKKRILDLEGSDLRGARLDYSNFAGANFHEAQLDHVRFAYANLAHATFSNARLPRAHLLQVDLSNAQLGGAVMANAYVARARFCAARMNNDMTNANLSHADLTGAQVGTADLTGADLEECNLSGAQFNQATRSTLHSSGAGESHTVYALLSQAQLDKAVCAPGQPPSIAEGTTDTETGLPLVWRGKNRHTCEDGAHLPCGNASCKKCSPCERCAELEQTATP